MKSGYARRAADRSGILPVLSPISGRTMRCWLTGNEPWLQVVHWVVHQNGKGNSEAHREDGKPCEWCDRRCRRYAMWYMGVLWESGELLAPRVLCVSEVAMSKVLLIDQDDELLAGKLLLVTRGYERGKSSPMSMSIDMGAICPDKSRCKPFDILPTLRHIFGAPWIGENEPS